MEFIILKGDILTVVRSQGISGSGRAPRRRASRIHERRGAPATTVAARTIVSFAVVVSFLAGGCSAEPGPLDDRFAGSWVYGEFDDAPVALTIPLVVRQDLVSFDVSAPCNDFTFAFIEDTGGEFTIGEWWQSAVGCEDDNDEVYTSIFIENERIAYEFTREGVTLNGGDSTLTLVRP